MFDAFCRLLCQYFGHAEDGEGGCYRCSPNRPVLPLSWE